MTPTQTLECVWNPIFVSVLLSLAPRLSAGRLVRIASHSVSFENGLLQRELGGDQLLDSPHRLLAGLGAGGAVVQGAS